MQALQGRSQGSPSNIRSSDSVATRNSQNPTSPNSASYSIRQETAQPSEDRYTRWFEQPETQPLELSNGIVDLFERPPECKLDWDLHGRSFTRSRGQGVGSGHS